VSDAIHHPWQTPPAAGEAIEIATDILWIRLPLPMALDHVNVYALADPEGWTLIDTGLSSRKTKAIWQSLIDGPLAGKPIRRLIVTHHHPDHIGLAGWFQSMGVELLIPRTAWLLARMLVLDEQPLPTPESMLFYQRAGLSAAMLAAKASERPFNFADVVDPLPQGFTRLEDGGEINAGGRRWQIRFGHGHAPDHATLWSLDDNLILGGDQLLPGISANIGVYPTEPEADPLGDWLTSTEAFAPLARPDHLVLPGHKLPFTGLPFRLIQMAENHHSALDRLRAHLATPQTAAACFLPLFKREITGDAFGMALVEAVAHLNYLLKRGLVSRSLNGEGAWEWRAP
jgi:glyoxylase-like metal-dependent hydrolase (beta-lactamase superfamily II)